PIHLAISRLHFFDSGADWLTRAKSPRTAELTGSLVSQHPCPFGNLFAVPIVNGRYVEIGAPPDALPAAVRLAGRGHRPGLGDPPLQLGLEHSIGVVFVADDGVDMDLSLQMPTRPSVIAVDVVRSLA